MIAPSGTQWLGLGQGERMSGSNMFVMYSSGDNNITLSPRLGRGQREPDVNPDARITLLDGTGISSDGVMTANLRCESCLTWQGGSMSPTNGNSDWIWSIRQGNALDSTDLSAEIREHDTYGGFTFDLPAGTSSDSETLSCNQLPQRRVQDPRSPRTQKMKKMHRTSLRTVHPQANPPQANPPLMASEKRMELSWQSPSFSYFPLAL